MKKVAVFDFDKTLITRDSFLPFLVFACGYVLVYEAVVEALARYAWRRVRRKPNESLRTFVKSFLLRRLLKGRSPEDLVDAVGKTQRWQKINEPVMQTLLDHHKNGDTIVIASGSLDLYLDELLEDIPHDAVICTNVGIKDGIITGEMTNGNCVRAGKAMRVKEWLETHGPFDESFGYGNIPHDLPMLNVVKHRIIISA